MRVICLAGALFLLGCSGFSNIADKGRGAYSQIIFVYDESSGLKLGQRVSRQIVGRGESVSIELRVVNDQDYPVEVIVRTGNEYGYCIRSSSGEIVAPRNGAQVALGKTVSIQSGERIEQGFVWKWDDPEIEPGIYEVTSGIGTRGLEVTTSPVSIELR